MFTLIYCIFGALNMFFGFTYIDEVVADFPLLEDPKKLRALYAGVLFLCWPLVIVSVIIGIVND
jgi:hypothetical protein